MVPGFRWEEDETETYHRNNILHGAILLYIGQVRGLGGLVGHKKTQGLIACGFRFCCSLVFVPVLAVDLLYLFCFVLCS